MVRIYVTRWPVSLQASEAGVPRGRFELNLQAKTVSSVCRFRKTPAPIEFKGGNHSETVSLPQVLGTNVRRSAYGHGSNVSAGEVSTTNSLLVFHLISFEAGVINHNSSRPSPSHTQTGRKHRDAARKPLHRKTKTSVPSTNSNTFENAQLDRNKKQQKQVGS